MRMTISTTPGSSVDRDDTVMKPTSLLIGGRMPSEGAIAAASACSSSGFELQQEIAGKALHVHDGFAPTY
jgi:hypothetical protein